MKRVTFYGKHRQATMHVTKKIIDTVIVPRINSLLLAKRTRLTRDNIITNLDILFVFGYNVLGILDVLESENGISRFSPGDRRKLLHYRQKHYKHL